MVLLACVLTMDASLAELPQVGNEHRPTPLQERHSFTIHDSNRDGLLNKQEYQHFVEQLTNRHRANSHPLQPAPPPLRFEIIDSNSDGNITEEEMIEALNQRLRQQRRRHRGGRTGPTGN